MTIHRRVGTLIAGTAIVLAACSSSSATTAPASQVPASQAPASQAPASQAPASQAPAASAAGSPAAGAACAPATGTSGTPATIQGFAFPTGLSIKAGDAVAWTNGDSTNHTVTFDDGSCSTDVNAGKTVVVTYLTPGTHTFHCSIHSNMKGSIEVK